MLADNCSGGGGGERAAGGKLSAVCDIVHATPRSRRVMGGDRDPLPLPSLSCMQYDWTTTRTPSIRIQSATGSLLCLPCSCSGAPDGNRVWRTRGGAFPGFVILPMQPSGWPRQVPSRVIQGGRPRGGGGGGWPIFAQAGGRERVKDLGSGDGVELSGVLVGRTVKCPPRWPSRRVSPSLAARQGVPFFGCTVGGSLALTARRTTVGGVGTVFLHGGLDNNSVLPHDRAPAGEEGTPPGPTRSVASITLNPLTRTTRLAKSVPGGGKTATPRSRNDAEAFRFRGAQPWLKGWRHVVRQSHPRRRTHFRVGPWPTEPCLAGGTPLLHTLSPLSNALARMCHEKRTENGFRAEKRGHVGQAVRPDHSLDVPCSSTRQEHV